MNSNPGDGFLKAVVQNEATEHLRDKSLHAGLAALKRRRMSRQVLAAGALICIAGATAVTVIGTRPGLEKAQFPSIASRQTLTQPAAAANEAIKRITDEELLALFPKSTVALVGSPGNQRFLVYSPVKNQLLE